MSGTPTLPALLRDSQIDEALIRAGLLDQIAVPHVFYSFGREVEKAVRAALASGATQPSEPAAKRLMKLSDEAEAKRQVETNEYLERIHLGMRDAYRHAATLATPPTGEPLDVHAWNESQGFKNPAVAGEPLTAPSEPHEWRHAAGGHLCYYCGQAWRTNEPEPKNNCVRAVLATPPTEEPLTAPSEPDTGKGYTDFLRAEFGPGMGQDRGSFSIGNVARAFGAGAALAATAAPTDHATMLRLLDTAITHGHTDAWLAERRELVKQLKAKQ